MNSTAATVSVDVTGSYMRDTGDLPEAIHPLLQRAVCLIGPTRGRWLFLMDEDNTYWLRTDMTEDESVLVADTLASWLGKALVARKETYTSRRLFDDGEQVPR